MFWNSVDEGEYCMLYILFQPGLLAGPPARPGSLPSLLVKVQTQPASYSHLQYVLYCIRIMVSVLSTALASYGHIQYQDYGLCTLYISGQLRVQSPMYSIRIMVSVSSTALASHGPLQYQDYGLYTQQSSSQHWSPIVQDYMVSVPSAVLKTMQLCFAKTSIYSMFFI